MLPHTKVKRLPITKDLLGKITAPPPTSIEDFNTDAAFKIAWAGFPRMGEITYTAAQAKKTSFSSIKATRSDISFAEDDEYAVLRLKRSKTDIEHSGVQMILAATGEPTCPVIALCRLFAVDPQPPNEPLFRLGSGAFRG